jgi:hypothetical protein
MKKILYEIITEENDGWVCSIMLCRDKAELDASVARLKVEEKGDVKNLLIREIEVEVVAI